KFLEDHTATIERNRTAELAVAEREYELSTVVHDINNTVQDLSLLCDGILEGIGTDEPARNQTFAPKIERIATIARSMATMVSDAKRRRELERLQDLSPREVVEVSGVLRELIEFARIRAERKRITVEATDLGEEEIWVNISAREHFETILRN